MRIGILTFHKSLNNGSALQAFALKKTVQDLLPGSDVSVIDYKPQKYDLIYSLTPPRRKNPLRQAFQCLCWALISDLIAAQKRSFRSFWEKYLSLSEKKYFFDSDLESLNSEYDILITGSDQIWNTRCADSDPVYFLPIRHGAKKISYAPSLNAIRELDPAHVAMVMDYDRVSVREQQGKQTLESYLGDAKDVFVAADPTLLLDPTVYESFGLSRIVKGRYIFLYTIRMSKDVLLAAARLSRSFGLPVYTMTVKPAFKRLRKFADGHIRLKRYHNGPVDFLRYMKNAEFVVTDSFHGTAFSVIFQKPFYSINIRKPTGLRNDERICSLLDRLEIRDRYITVDALDAIDIHSKIDYEAVARLKRDYANESIEWLKRALEQ